MFKWKWFATLCLLEVGAIGMFASGQEPAFIPRKQVAPPGPPLTPEQAIQKMTVPPGFHVELVASEPDLQNPVAMAFDDRGRIYVTESFEYPRHEPGPGRDRIKILEDTDRDGRVDRVKIFAEGLNIPSGIAVGHGGVWVANAPDILFLEDTDGDDRADRFTVVVTGFGRDDTHELPNALTWGPDGWLYGLNGVFNPCRVEQDGKTFEFTCAMFRIDPKSRRFELFCEGTSNPWGIAFDHEGSAFISACVIDHLWHLTESGYYHRQGGPYPPHTWKAESIVDYTHQMAAYCGIEYFESTAYPKEYRNALYMGNIHGGCINVDRVERSGSTYRGKKGEDFLTANDVWFMPVAQKVGPDGCLYVLDWYDRYHCYQDASADPKGVDRGHGRLYRIVYGERPKPDVPDISVLNSQDLIDCLKHDNAFVRQRAQLEIAERSDASMDEMLVSILFDTKQSMRTRLQTLWAWSGTGRVSDEALLKLLSDPDPAVQAWAVRTAGQMASQSSKIRKAVHALVQAPDPRVRVQVAIAANKLGGAEATQWLLEVLRQDRDDVLIPRIVWRNLLPKMISDSNLIEEQLHTGLKSDDHLTRMAPRLVDRWLSEVAVDGKELRGAEWLERAGRVLESLCIERPDLAVVVLDGVLQKTLGGPWNVPAMQPVLAKWSKLESLIKSTDGSLQRMQMGLHALSGDSSSQARILKIAMERSTPDHERVTLLRCGLFHQPAQFSVLLDTVLNSAEKNEPISSAVRDFVLGEVVRASEPEAVRRTLAGLKHFPIQLQATIVDRLCQRESNARLVLEQVAAEKLNRDLIGPNQVRRLAQSKSAELNSLVQKVFGEVRTENADDRQKVVREKSEFLYSVARGDIERGWKVYDRICGQCHVLHGRGLEVGPNITRNGRGSFEQLVSSVFDPSLVVGEAYKSTIVATDDGRVLQGLLVEKNDQRVVLKVQGGKLETIPADEIDTIKTSLKSLMPEGVELQLTNQEIADLFALLSIDIPPEGGDPVRVPGTPSNLHNGDSE